MSPLDLRKILSAQQAHIRRSCEAEAWWATSMSGADDSEATSASAPEQRPAEQRHERGANDQTQSGKSTLALPVRDAGVAGCTPELFSALVEEFGEVEGTAIAKLVANEQLGSHLALQMLSKAEMRELLSWGNFLDETYVDRLRAALATSRERLKLSQAGERYCGRAAMFCGLSTNGPDKEPSSSSFFERVGLNFPNPFK